MRSSGGERAGSAPPATRAAAPAGQGLSPGMARLLAVTCAVTVANIYYAQPLLHAIAGSLRVSQSAASLLVTAGQLGYAAGLLLIVPAGEIVRRRPLLTGMLSVCTLALAASAAAPGLTVLAAVAVLTGVTSVVVQMLVPYAATMASDDQRGKVIGTLMGGVLTGILLSRTLAGLIAAAGGWRTVYIAAAVVMAATTLVLRRALPDHARQLDISYAAQMRGVAQVIRTQPVVRWRALLGGAAFGAFSGFWTTVTFLLAGPGFRFSQLGIGLFALVGAAGAITAVRLGRALDSRRHLRWAATGITLAGLLASFAVIGVAGNTRGTIGLALLVIGVLAMDACVQGTHVLSQSVIYDLLPGARSRITTVYMTTNFLGGAAGSAAAAQAWDHAGWTGATGVAEAFILLGLVCWLAVRRHETAARPERP